MRLAAALTFVFLLFPSSAFAEVTAIHECVCTYLPNAATAEVNQTFENLEWVPRGETPNGELCQKFCTSYAAGAGGTFTSAAYSLREEEVFKGLKPVLGVDIPGFEGFQDPVRVNGVLQVGFIGEYIAAIYRWLIGIMAVFAVIMIMVGGIQYMLQGGSQQGVTEAKQRITNALVGMVILLGSYTLLYTTNPQLTLLNAIRIKAVDSIDSTLSPSEGPAVASSTTTAIGTALQSCKDAEQAAYARTCPLSQTYKSPVRTSYSCNYHFRANTPNYDSSKMRGLDYAVPWGTEIFAPQNGTVLFKKGSASNRCGNQIDVIFDGAILSMCHVKDFIGESGRIVKQGEAIGHSGGRCCSGETKPTGGAWATANISGTCTYSGTPCADPFSQESCTCQPIEQSGNTTGPHVHTTFKIAGDVFDPLVCLR